MTEEELRTEREFKRQIANCIHKGIIQGKISLTIASDVLALIREAGWKSPEDCKAEFMIDFEAWVREQNRGKK